MRGQSRLGPALIIEPPGELVGEVAQQATIASGRRRWSRWRAAFSAGECFRRRQVATGGGEGSLMRRARRGLAGESTGRFSGRSLSLGGPLSSPRWALSVSLERWRGEHRATRAINRWLGGWRAASGERMLRCGEMVSRRQIIEGQQRALSSPTDGDGHLAIDGGESGSRRAPGGLRRAPREAKMGSYAPYAQLQPPTRRQQVGAGEREPVGRSNIRALKTKLGLGSTAADFRSHHSHLLDDALSFRARPASKPEERSKGLTSRFGPRVCGDDGCESNEVAAAEEEEEEEEAGELERQVGSGKLAETMGPRTADGEQPATGGFGGPDEYKNFDPYSIYGDEDEEEDVWYSEERLFEVSPLGGSATGGSGPCSCCCCCCSCHSSGSQRSPRGSVRSSGLAFNGHSNRHLPMIVCYGQPFNRWPLR